MTIDPDITLVVLQLIGNSSVPIGWYQLARSKAWYRLDELLKNRGQELPSPPEVLSQLQASGLIAATADGRGYAISDEGRRYLQGGDSGRVACNSDGRFRAYRHDGSGESYYTIDDEISCQELIRIREVCSADRELTVSYEIVGGLIDDTLAQQLIEDKLLGELFGNRFAGRVDMVLWMNEGTGDVRKSKLSMR